MIAAFSTLTLLYCAVVFFLRMGLNRLPLPDTHPPHTISVIVAARNEELSLPRLLPLLLAQDHSNYEIVVADDRSEDGTSRIIEEFATRSDKIRWIRVNDTRPDLVGKKRALTEAIAISRGDILVFTDADSEPGSQWLSTVDSYFTDKVDFLFGPSPLITNASRFYDRVKNFERAVHHSVAAAALGWGWGMTCSAANMAYRRSLFDEVGGFSGIGHIRSGDDDLMLQKLAPSARKLTFMFASPGWVRVQERSTPRERLERETRRASKFRHYTLSVKLFAVMIFLYFLLLPVTVVLWLAGLFPGWLLGTAILLKCACEWSLLHYFLSRMKRQDLLTVFPLAEILYIVYYLYFAVRGTLVNYRWR